VLSAERLLRLIDGIGGIVWEADPDTFRLAFVSAQAERILGYPVSDWLEQPDFWTSHTHPDDVERCTAFCRAAARDGLDHAFEHRMLAADGRTVWLRDIVTVRRQPDGSRMLVGLLLDITAQKTEAAEKQRLSRLHEALLENSSDNITLLTADGATVYQSAAVTRQLGYAPEDLAGRRNVELVHPDDQRLVEDKLREVFATDAAVGPVGFRVRHADGRWRTLESISKRFIDQDGSLFAVSNTRDVTDVVDAQRDLEAVRAQVAHASKMEAIGRLAGGIAHDFNNLLTVMGGYADLLAATMQTTDPRLADLEEIRRAARRASLLTRQLLAFSRKQVMRPELLDLNPVVGEMAGLIRRLIGEDVQLEVDTCHAPLILMADRAQLGQVLMNLAVNARDAMPEGGRLTIRTRDDGDQAILEVEDTGAGMSDEVTQRAFDPFFTTKDVGKGTGLGLSTVYGIVRQTGGDVTVRSETGRGTQFTIRLPLAEPARAATAATPRRDVHERDTVLLVEDEPHVRDLVSHVLRRLGYEVLVASDQAGAAALCHEHGAHIRLLLTDVMLPGATGPDVVRQAVAIVPNIRVLYMSGYADDTAPLPDVREGGAPFIQKPFTSSALAEKIREVLDDSGAT
jgi:two-component system, cell cycle sensor histidine kinase and response regulator CckA